jgi:small ligand-binding sensory domain FIST
VESAEPARTAALGAPVDGAAPGRIAGAVYVSCAGRGGPHFGAPSAELQVIRHALGDVPLVGFFAAGEIGHRHLYGYTGVLTVFLGGVA